MVVLGSICPRFLVSNKGQGLFSFLCFSWASFSFSVSLSLSLSLSLFDVESSLFLLFPSLFPCLFEEEREENWGMEFFFPFFLYKMLPSCCCLLACANHVPKVFAQAMCHHICFTK